MTETGLSFVFRKSLLVHVLVLGVFGISGTHGNETPNLSIMPEEAFENTSVTLTCSYSGPLSGDGFMWNLNTTGSQPTSKRAAVSKSNCQNFLSFLGNTTVYSYSCDSNTTHYIILRNIRKQSHGEIWQCGLIVGDVVIWSNLVTVLVTVPVMEVFIRPYNSKLTIPEKSKFTWTCLTSPCRPKPKFLWYITNDTKPNGSRTIVSESISTESSTDTLMEYTDQPNVTVNRIWNNRYLFCGANNSKGNLVLSEKVLLDVTYPPDGPPSISNLPNKGEFKVLQNDFVRLECLVTGGNPLLRLEWSKHNEIPQQINGNTIIKTTSWQAIGRDPEDLTCLSFHTHGNNTVQITINILYPPDKPDISIETSSGKYVIVNNTISIIEGRTFKLNCSARSNPPVSLFKWNDLSYLSNFYTARSDRHTQSISCSVSNEMRFSDSRTPMTGHNISRLEVDVLYPPTMKNLKNTTVQEGDNIDYSCDFVNGNPGVTEITWTGINQTWSGQQLQLKNVSRNQEGLYRCTVHNYMSSWDGIQVVGNVSGEFYLSVEGYVTDGSSPTSSNVSVVAASASGTVVGVVILVAVLITIIVYRKRKRLSYQKRDIPIQYYNFSATKVAELNISTEVDRADAYEAFQSTAQNERLNVYEGLRNTGFDQHYEQISPIASNVEKGHHMVYENLQLTCNSEMCQDGKSPITVQTALQKQYTQSLSD